jgi:hypothetical protein
MVVAQLKKKKKKEIRLHSLNTIKSERKSFLWRKAEIGRVNA